VHADAASSSDSDGELEVASKFIRDDELESPPESPETPIVEPVTPAPATPPPSALKKGDKKRTAGIRFAEDLVEVMGIADSGYNRQSPEMSVQVAVSLADEVNML